MPCSCTFPSLIFGPQMSPRAATCMPVFFAACLTILRECSKDWNVPWEKLILNTRTPSSMSLATISTVFVAGPSVAKIFVFNVLEGLFMVFGVSVWCGFVFI